MGKKTRVQSRYDHLPREQQKQVDTMLTDTTNTYQYIADTITQQGFPISRSSIGRYALRKNKNTRELEVRLAIAQEQAKVAANMARDGSTLDYAEGILNIVATEMANRLLTASEEEYDDMPISDVLKSVSRLSKDLNNIAKFRFSKDKGTTEIMQDVKKKYGYKCKTVFMWLYQSKNKKARILSNANYIMENVYFPEGWENKYSDCYLALSAYQAAGKNKHDDAADGLTGVSEI